MDAVPNAQSAERCWSDCDCLRFVSLLVASRYDAQPLLQAKCYPTITLAQASIMQLRTKHGSKLNEPTASEHSQKVLAVGTVSWIIGRTG